MEASSDDLFVVDAEQVVVELTHYGAGNSELPLDRLTGSLDYLASILAAIGLESEAKFAGLFAQGMDGLDEGETRRTIRDYAEIIQIQLNAARQGKPYVSYEETFERMLSRFDMANIASPGTRKEVDLVLDQANQTIVALNALRSQLLHAEQVIGTGVDLQEIVTAEHAMEVRSPEIPDLTEEVGVDPFDVDIELTISHAQADSADAVDQDQRSDDSKEAQSPTESGESHNVLDVSGELSKLQDSVAGKESIATVALEIPLRGPSIADRAIVRAPEISGVDEVFAKALKVVANEPWAIGFASLFEAIDELDHVVLAHYLPKTCSVSGAQNVRVHPRLAESFADELARLAHNLSIELSIENSTLVVGLHLNQPASRDRMARLAARFAGRIEVSADQLRWQLMLPASRRLLRVMPLRLYGEWVVASCAQFIDTQQSMANGKMVRLMFGDVPDRTVIQDQGESKLGIRFDLPFFLRKRDRYKGVVMLADGSLLPLLG